MPRGAADRPPRRQGTARGHRQRASGWPPGTLAVATTAADAAQSTPPTSTALTRTWRRRTDRESRGLGGRCRRARAPHRPAPSAGQAESTAGPVRRPPGAAHPRAWRRRRTRCGERGRPPTTRRSRCRPAAQPSGTRRPARGRRSGRAVRSNRAISSDTAPTPTWSRAPPWARCRSCATPEAQSWPLAPAAAGVERRVRAVGHPVPSPFLFAQQAMCRQHERHTAVSEAPEVSRALRWRRRRSPRGR